MTPIVIADTEHYTLEVIKVPNYMSPVYAIINKQYGVVEDTTPKLYEAYHLLDEFERVTYSEDEDREFHFVDKLSTDKVN